MNAKRLPARKDAGQSSSVEPLQVRLVLEQFQLAGRSGHVQIDDAPHFGRETAAATPKAGWRDRA